MPELNEEIVEKTPPPIKMDEAEDMATEARDKANDAIADAKAANDALHGEGEKEGLQGTEGQALTKAIDDAQDDVDAAQAKIDAAKAALNGVEGEGDEEDVAGLIEKRNDAEAARDATVTEYNTAQGDANTAKDALDTANGEAISKTNIANSATEALSDVITNRNSLTDIINNVIKELEGAIDGEASKERIDELLEELNAAKEELEDFDAENDIEALRVSQAEAEEAAIEARDAVAPLQKAFDDAVKEAQDALAALNAAELAFFKSQEDVYNETVGLNKAIAEYNSAMAALHEAEQDLIEALANAEHLEAVAQLLEANADAWDDYLEELGEYLTNLGKWQTDHGQWEKDHAEWSKGMDKDSQEYKDAYAAWLKEMEDRGLEVDKYESLLKAFEEAQKAHNEAMAAFKEREDAHKDALKEWQDYQDGIADGSIKPYTAEVIDNIPGNRISNDFNGNGTWTHGDGFPNIPGVTFYRGTGNTFILDVKEGAPQGEFSFGVRGTGDIWKITVSGVGKHEITFGPQSANNGFGNASFTSYDKPTFGENPPPFNETAPKPPEQGPPPKMPEYRGEEPKEPQQPTPPDLDLEEPEENDFERENGGEPIDPEELPEVIPQVDHPAYVPPTLNPDRPGPLVDNDPPDVTPQLPDPELPEDPDDEDPDDEDPDDEDPDDEDPDDEDPDDEDPDDEDPDDEDPDDEDPDDEDPDDEDPDDEDPDDEDPDDEDPDDEDPADPVDPVDPGPGILVIPPPPPAPVPPPAPPADPVEVPVAEFEIPDLATPLAAPPVEPDDLGALTIIEDPGIPLAPPAMGEVAGFLTTGLILATLIAAVVGNSIRKMRTEEQVEEQE